MTLSKVSRLSSSFESLRKQAKRLVRLVEAGDSEAMSRIKAQLPAYMPPLSLRDAQLVVAREYGFAGWQDLRTAALRQAGKGLEWAAAEAERAIHDHQVDRLIALVREYPALLSWQDDDGGSLLAFATGSFGDSGDPSRERMFTRLESAEFLLDAGAIVDPEIWEGVIRARAKETFQLLSRKGVLPRQLHVLAALGDLGGVQDGLAGHDAAEVTQAFLAACRFGHRTVAALLLPRCIELDPELGQKIDRWKGRSAFIDYLVDHSQIYDRPWLTVVMGELHNSIEEDNLEEFVRWLREEPDLLGEANIALQVELIEHATWADGGSFITRFLQLKPAFLRANPRPATMALAYALEYGNAHLIPLLTPIWPLLQDLCHMAGIGDFPGVRRWFDDSGHVRLGSLAQHYPTNNPWILGNLRWSPPNAQHVLDVALAWSVLNHHFEIATFLLERGANINTDWSTHEPASILHECAVHGNYEAAQFLIDHGIDLTIHDYRWNATAEGWAFNAAKDEKMAKFLADAEQRRGQKPN